MIIGLDDTDSRTEGMCTTYLALKIASEASNHGEIRDIILYRLNPNNPHRTRGNACLAIKIETENQREITDLVRHEIEQNAVFSDEETNPGAAFLDEENYTEELAKYSLETVKEIQTKEHALEVAENHNIETEQWKNGRGIIGAIAALGAQWTLKDHSYELITYRDREKWSEERKINPDSVYRADTEFYPELWDTVDRENNSICAVPATKGPVLYGLRSNNQDTLWRANSVIDSQEIDDICLFKTNQGTDMHVIQEQNPNDLQEYRNYRYRGEVTTPPKTREGGHVFFELDNAVKCVAFEPTKQFRRYVRRLREGDQITAQGGYIDDTLNLEKLRVDELEKVRYVNPECASCGRNMESAGRNQGYRCRKCGTSSPEKKKQSIQRKLEEKWYEVPPIARRHIARPLCRKSIDNEYKPRDNEGLHRVNI